MSKIRLYLNPARIKKDILIKERYYLHKIKDVLRLKQGQTVYIFNGEGREWEYKMVKLNQKELFITKIKKNREKAKEKQTLTLAFPLIQAKKTDFILQKATELGASDFMPFTCARTLKLKFSQKKMQRWQKIILEACRQSERLWLPEIHSPIKLQELAFQKFGRKLAALPNRKKKVEMPQETKPGQPAQSILCIVGPEGGFSAEEIKSFEKNKFTFINLSPNILRTETAAIFATGLIKYLTNQNNAHKNKNIRVQS